MNKLEPGKENILNLLTENLGKESVLYDSDSLAEYFDDMTELEGHLADFIVTITSKEDIEKVVAIANEYTIPVIPVVAKTNLGGLTIPSHGGIILDLKKMNRIIEVNETDMYMVIEPGVTFGDVKEYLDTHHPSLRMGYPLSPPYTSVAANCLLDGLGTLSLKHGSMGDWINGVEAVLANGEVITTGSRAYSQYWCSNSPMPDLTGLFLNFQATTGIITKVAVQLWPQVQYRKRLFILCYKTDDAHDLIKKLAYDNICDDIGGISWPLGKMLFGEKKPIYRDENEPIMFIYVDISSNYEKEMKVKIELLNDILKEMRKKEAQFEEPFDVEQLVNINPEFKKFSEMPTTLDFLLDHGGGGLTWVGTYGPISQWQKAVTEGSKIMDELAFPPCIVSRVMRGGHFCVVRFITIFDKSKSDEVQQVKDLNYKLAKICLDLGFIPYKTPNWVIKLMKSKLNPVFQKWVQKIQTLMDPNHIMNPGKWDLK